MPPSPGQSWVVQSKLAGFCGKLSLSPTKAQPAKQKPNPTFRFQGFLVRPWGSAPVEVPQLILYGRRLLKIVTPKHGWCLSGFHLELSTFNTFEALVLSLGVRFTPQPAGVQVIRGAAGGVCSAPRRRLEAGQCQLTLAQAWWCQCGTLRLAISPLSSLWFCSETKHVSISLA